MKWNLEQFEHALIKSLRKEGFILPFESEDYEYYIKKFKKDNTPPLPDNLNDVNKIIKRGYIKKSYPTEINNGTTDDMARAAREGKSIPQNILDKMKADRENSKKSD